MEAKDEQESFLKSGSPSQPQNGQRKSSPPSAVKVDLIGQKQVDRRSLVTTPSDASGKTAEKPGALGSIPGFMNPKQSSPNALARTEGAVISFSGVNYEVLVSGGAAGGGAKKGGAAGKDAPPRRRCCCRGKEPKFILKNVR